jgi:adenosylcobyric acid synthase
MGTTESGCNREALVGEGSVSEDGLVFGTYLHGIFLNPSAVNALLSYLFAQKNLPFTPISAGESDPYETLADLFEKHVDMNAIVNFLAL